MITQKRHLRLCESKINRALFRDHRQWSGDRDEFHRQMPAGNREVLERDWQKNHFQGHDLGGERVEEH